MSALALGALAKLWPYLLAALAFGGGLLKWRSSIIKGERAKQASAEAKARSVADEVDSDIGMLPPELARKELSKWSKP